MRDQLWAAAQQAGGVLSRREALDIAARHVLDDMLAEGLLTRAFPSTYVLSSQRNDRSTLRRAALAYRGAAARRRPSVAARRPPALSHLDALEVWGLPVPPLPTTGEGAVPVHVREGPGPAVKAKGIEVHRRLSHDATASFELRPSGLITIAQEHAIVDSWAMLPARDQRAPLIVALRDRRVSPTEVRTALAVSPNLAGAADMRRIVQLVEAGCHSELELWGHAHVFSHPLLSHGKAQYEVRVTSRRKVRLDRYYVDEMVDVELDGAAYHGLPGQRERDLRRDAALSALGILVVRLSHQRLHAQPVEVVAELVDILAMRRRQLGIA